MVSMLTERARCGPVIWESTVVVVLAAKSSAVSCLPGRTWTAAARPSRNVGSAIAPSSTSFFGSVVAVYIFSFATIRPGVPASIVRLATSTGVGAEAPPTRAR